MEEYRKQALDTPDLLAMLKQRGLVVGNDEAALQTLSVISYFRLACYFRPMEADKQTHEFREGTTLEQVLALYEFDTALRDLVFSSTRRIEVALRTRINHHFSRHHSPFWFTQVDLATDGHLFVENLGSVDRELHRSKEDFIKEHFARYDRPGFPPAWKTLETMTFGTLSKLYGNFISKPDKIYPQLCCIAYLLNSIEPQCTFTADMKALLAKYPTVSPSAMGFKPGWEQEPLWQ